jgi:hypothetical protein
MTDKLDHIEARMIANEMFIRAIMCGIVARATDPVADLEKWADQFRETVGFLRITGVNDDHSERLRDLIRTMGDGNFDAIRSRLFREIEIEAAKSGQKN